MRAGLSFLKGEQKFPEIPLLFYDRGPYQLATSQLICSVNHLTSFYIRGTSIMKQATKSYLLYIL